jgi:dTDP-glucose pyrophosphorylase
LFHSIIDHINHYNFWNLNNKLKIKFAFQDPEKYGPAAALLPWANVNDNVIVLLGDNYLKGKLDKDLIKTCGAVASYKELPFDKMNSKRFAAIVPTEKPSAFIIKEKPHNINEGKFYIGYMMFSKDMMQYVVNLKPSIRNEYEITDLFNEAFYSKIVPVFDTWCDITYQEDKEKMTNIIRESQIRS